MTNLEMVAAELEAAKKKHPKFVDCLVRAYDDNYNIHVKGRRGNKAHIREARDNLQGFRDDLKWWQDNKLVDVADILSCEICEAEEAYLTNDFAHARQEFAQCAAVCIRAMEYIQQQQQTEETK